MSLRDYFAAKIIGGFAADPNMAFEPSDRERIASLAYATADEMMKAREQLCD